MMGKTCSDQMCMTHKIALLLVVVGALNWGLIGVFEFNLVTWLFGAWATVVRVVYVLIGLSALMLCGAGKCCLKEK